MDIINTTSMNILNTTSMDMINTTDVVDIFSKVVLTNTTELRNNITSMNITTDLADIFKQTIENSTDAINGTGNDTKVSRPRGGPRFPESLLYYFLVSETLILCRF